MNRLGLAVYLSACAVIVAMATGFVAFDIWRKSGWTWPEADNAVATPGTRQPSPQPEIRRYVAFVTVTNTALRVTVTTGIRYDSSSSRRIERQWCYAHPVKSDSGGLAYRLDIGWRDAKGPLNKNAFSAQALSQFGLSRAEASSLINDCRFRAP